MQTIDVSRVGLVALAAATLALSACGGGGGSSGGGGGSIPIPAPSSTVPPASPTPSTAPTATPTPPGSSSQTIVTSAGSITGTQGTFKPAEGDTSSGGQGQPVDGFTCDAQMSDNYHVHAFVGLYVNGTLTALPAGIGMQNPQPPQNGFVNVASCFYHIHTHDQSGLIHIEDPNPKNIPYTQAMYTFKNVLDIWGITADANHFGPYTGPVRVFTSGQFSRGKSTVTADTFTYYGSDPNTIWLYSHEVIFIEVGPKYPALPNVHFYEQQ